MRKKFAFTLAEVLTTLMVIGVVAAVTIPSLVNAYQERNIVIGLKKSYSDIVRAMKMIPTEEDCPVGDYECFHFFDLTLKEQIELFKKQFNVGFSSETGGCGFTGLPMNRACFITTSGVSYSFGSVYLNPIYVDVNGRKPPNKAGKDIFRFQLAKERKGTVQIGTVFPDGSLAYEEYGGANSWRDRCTPDATGTSLFACTARILELGTTKFD